MIRHALNTLTRISSITAPSHQGANVMQGQSVQVHARVWVCVCSCTLMYVPRENVIS